MDFLHTQNVYPDVLTAFAKVAAAVSGERWHGSPKTAAPDATTRTTERLTI